MSAKTDFLKGILSVGTGNIVLNASGIVVVLLATRYVTAEELGVYFLVVVVAGILSSIAGMGIKISLIKHISETDDVVDKTKIISSTALFYICTLVLVASIAVSCNWFLKYMQVHLSYILLFFSLALFEFSNTVLQSLKEFRAIAINNTINGVCKVVTLPIFLTVFKLGFTGLLYSAILASSLPILLQVCRLRSRFRLEDLLHMDITQVAKVLKFGFPLYLNELYANLYDRGYTILIAAFLSPTAVAYFNISTRISALVDNIRAVYGSVYLPTILSLLKTGQSRVSELLRLSITMGCLTVLSAAFFLFLFKDSIIAILFTKKYMLVSTAAVIMLAKSAPSFSGSLMGQTIVALGYNKTPFRINLLVTSVTFFGSYFLIRKMGFMGVVYMAIAGDLLGLLLNWLYLKSKGINAGLPNLLFVFGSITVLLFAIWLNSVFMGAVSFVLILIALFYATFRLVNEHYRSIFGAKIPTSGSEGGLTSV